MNTNVPKIRVWMWQKPLKKKKKYELSEPKNSFQYDKTGQSKGRENKAKIKWKKYKCVC